MEKHTPGPWKPMYVGPICIGVGTVAPITTVICNSILPDTDKEYEKHKANIEADMNLIAKAPDMKKLLQDLAEWEIDNHLDRDLSERLKQLIK